MHFPQGVIGWTIFATGMFVIMYRVRGIDTPRAWIEWCERQFTYAVNLRFAGGIMLLFAATLAYVGRNSLELSLVGWTFRFCIACFALIGIGLLLFQNHLRHILFATAESSDKMIRISSIAIVLFGLGLMLLPFFY